MKPNYKAWQITPVNLSSMTNKERLCHLIGYAAIAPSAHNSQPWKFKINDTTQTIFVSIESSRTLPVSDKKLRQAYLSIGAAIQNIVLAANAHKAECKVKLQTKKQPVAKIHIKWPKAWKTPNNSQLNLLTSRQCNHSKYRKNFIDIQALLPTNHLEIDGASIHLISDKRSKQKVGQAANQAVKKLMTKQFRQELSEWVHPNWTNQYTGMPAAIQGIPGPVSAVAKTLIKNLPIQVSQAKKDQKNLSNAPILALICTDEDDIAHWIQAGRTLQNLLLHVTNKNLDATVLGASIEYTSSRATLQNTFGTSELPVALVRIGQATKSMPRAPRLSTKSVINNR